MSLQTCLNLPKYPSPPHPPSPLSPFLCFSFSAPAIVIVFILSKLPPRGAYCAAVIISLLNLPLDLTRESSAWTSDQSTLFTKLADYVQRCKYLSSPSQVPLKCSEYHRSLTCLTTTPQARPLREAYRLIRTLRHMVHMPSAH